jgi:hypothetical protein
MDKNITNDFVPGRLIFKWIKWFFLVILITAPNLSRAQTDQTVREMQVKAAFLYNFTKFVYWKSSPETGTLSTITIGLIQADEMAGLLNDYVSKSSSNSGVTVKRIKSLSDDLSGCQIIYIDQSQKEDLPEILKRLNGGQVLTVSDIPGFTRKGGVIGLFQEDGRIKIEINQSEAESSGLEISAKLMEVARVIK